MATKRSGGSTRNNKDSKGKMLGVKKYGNEKVFPGNIIIRQRGSKYHAGINVGKGKDFTLFALTKGNIKYNYNKLTKKLYVSVI